MDTFAFCCASFAKSVQRAAGVKPLLSPPVTFKDFNPTWLMGHDLIYLKLHGLPSQPYWYGDDWTTALHVSAFNQVALKGTVIFIANCHFAETPFLQALLHTGATVIGGSGPNFAQANAIVGADYLGRAIREEMELNARPAQALATAKEALKASTRTMQRTLKRTVNPARHYDLEERIRANLDTLSFRIYTEEL